MIIRLCEDFDDFDHKTLLDLNIRFCYTLLGTLIIQFLKTFWDFDHKTLKTFEDFV